VVPAAVPVVIKGGPNATVHREETGGEAGC
jgi:hypothetical protein